MGLYPVSGHFDVTCMVDLSDIHLLDNRTWRDFRCEVDDTHGRNLIIGIDFEAHQYPCRGTRRIMEPEADLRARTGRKGCVDMLGDNSPLTLESIRRDRYVQARSLVMNGTCISLNTWMNGIAGSTKQNTAACHHQSTSLHSAFPFLFKYVLVLPRTKTTDPEAHRNHDGGYPSDPCICSAGSRHLWIDLADRAQGNAQGDRQVRPGKRAKSLSAVRILVAPCSWHTAAICASDTRLPRASASVHILWNSSG